jgi:archaellum component FlaC
METLKVWNKYHNNQCVDNALGSIQHDAQNKLSAWASEMLDETNNRLTKSSENFSLTSQYFQNVSQLYKNMSKGILPIKLSKEQEQHKLLIIFDAIMRNNNELLMLAEQGIDTINETSDYVAKLITMGAEIYRQYYNIIYEMIMEPTFDKQYTTTMFSMHDLLPAEYKSLLPAPHHVFEHMLQTTKLYTQTELL